MGEAWKTGSYLNAFVRQETLHSVEHELMKQQEASPECQTGSLIQSWRINQSTGFVLLLQNKSLFLIR